MRSYVRGGVYLRGIGYRIINLRLRGNWNVRSIERRNYRGKKDLMIMERLEENRFENYCKKIIDEFGYCYIYL